jgi:hypothetical protein
MMKPTSLFFDRCPRSHSIYFFTKTSVPQTTLRSIMLSINNTWFPTSSWSSKTTTADDDCGDQTQTIPKYHNNKEVDTRLPQTTPDYFDGHDYDDNEEEDDDDDDPLVDERTAAKCEIFLFTENHIF